MRVVVLSLLMDQWLLMASRTFAMRGHEVLIVTNPHPYLGDSDHEDALVRFHGFPNTQLISIRGISQPFRLSIQSVRLLSLFARVDE